MEPEQGEVINGPNLGDLSRRRAGPSAGNRSAAKPLEHEPEFVLSETSDPFRATWPFELAASRGTIFEPVQLRPTLALSHPKTESCDSHGDYSNRPRTASSGALDFFSVRSCRGVSLPPVSVTDRARFLGAVVYSIYFQFMQNQFISAAAAASPDGDRGLFYMACLSVDNLGMPAPTDERQTGGLWFSPSRVFPGFPWFRRRFYLVFPWFSLGFALVFLWFKNSRKPEKD